jgi:hypothetical protein
VGEEAEDYGRFARLESSTTHSHVNLAFSNLMFLNCYYKFADIRVCGGRVSRGEHELEARLKLERIADLPLVQALNHREGLLSSCIYFVFKTRLVLGELSVAKKFVVIMVIEFNSLFTSL